LVIDIRRSLEGLLRIREMAVWSRTKRDVAGGNETAVPGRVTTANDGMRGGLRGRRLTVALPLDVVGELHRQRSKSHVRTTAKSRILDRLTASSEQAIQRRRVEPSQIRRDSRRNMQPGRSRDYRLNRRMDGTPIGRPSTTSTVERQTSWTTHELTSRRARNPAPRHPRLGADRRQRHTCHPAQDPSR
jgi:hypothetical protein